MTLTYNHCGVTWEADDGHWHGDECLVCGKAVEPAQPEEAHEDDYDEVP